jgi:tight adherence protein C
VEAGLGFDAAMSKVNEKWDNELSLAFGRVIREVQLGKLRRDALRDMAIRLGVAEMTSFVAAVIQSEMLGVSMAKVLRIQSDQMA